MSCTCGLSSSLIVVSFPLQWHCSEPRASHAAWSHLWASSHWALFCELGQALLQLIRAKRPRKLFRHIFPTTSSIKQTVDWLYTSFISIFLSWCMGMRYKLRKADHSQLILTVVSWFLSYVLSYKTWISLANQLCIRVDILRKSTQMSSESIKGFMFTVKELLYPSTPNLVYTFTGNGCYYLCNISDSVFYYMIKSLLLY